MISGDHSHFCPDCKQSKQCAIITHCKRPAIEVCDDCLAKGKLPPLKGGK